MVSENTNGLFTSQTKEEEEVEHKQTCAQTLWIRWVAVCRSINVFLERLFTRLGFAISRSPKLTILFGLLISLLLMGGFARYRLIKRSEDLYIPQNSQALRDLKRAEDNFLLRYKLEEFIIKEKNNNGIILKDEIFKIALEIHVNIISMPEYQNVCIKNNKDLCIVSSALEIFQFENINLKNVSETLNKVFKDHTVMSNTGRQAYTNFPSYFAYFQFDAQLGEISRADALRNIYLVNDPTTDDIYEQLTIFETAYIRYMDIMAESLDKRGLILLYNCGRSVDISLNDSAKKDITLIPIALLLMVLFCGMTLARFRNCIVGHFTLGLMGIFTLFLGIGSAFSFIMLVGGPYVAFAGVLPFLVLGVGIDNMFIIIDAVDRQHPTLTSNARIAKALGEVGASITMTTFTDLVAFFVSMVTDFPAIRYFCMYAAFSISFCYVLVITVFVAMLTFDVRRIESRKYGVVQCIEKTEEKVPDVWQDGKETISNKLMARYAKFLMKKPVKCVLIILSLFMISFGVYGAVNVDQEFDQLVLGLDDSAYVKYFRYFNDAYPTGATVNVIIDQQIDYTDQDVQTKYSELSNIAKENKYMKDSAVNWMHALVTWAENGNTTITGGHFYPALYQFLKQHPQFYIDLKLHNTTKTIEASRMIILTKDNSHSIHKRDAMLALRHDLNEKTSLPVYGVAYVYIFIEQFVIVLSDTIRNLAICASAILVITLPYLVDPKVTFFVCFGFVSLMFELFGVMYLWGVSLNAISMIIMVMGIGFSVDYSAHIAHAFVVSNKKSTDQRVIFALRTMGSSVAMGGVSTFIGVIVTAFSGSELFKIFFKMVFGIVVLGLIHGLVFLPVCLAVCCNQNIQISLEENHLTNERSAADQELLDQNDETDQIV